MKRPGAGPNDLGDLLEIVLHRHADAPATPERALLIGVFAQTLRELNGRLVRGPFTARDAQEFLVDGRLEELCSMTGLPVEFVREMIERGRKK